MKYAMPTDIGAVICSGDTPFPAGSAWPVPPELEVLPEKYRKIENGVLLEKTAEEKAQADLDEAARKAQEEAQRQLGKPLRLKIVENTFLSICDTLTGQTSHVKLGFDTLNTIISGITDPNTKVLVSLQLLSIDAEAKREGGLLWWDDCTWHPEIV